MGSEDLSATATEQPSNTSSTKKTGSRGRRIAINALRVVLGLLVGCVIAELAFRLRDHGAFPHLNVYEPDPVLGARLRPGATQTVAFGGNPATNVRIGTDGIRGDTPAAAAGDCNVLVVGDSQVFGLGVEEEQRFTNVFANEKKCRVVNAGIPTYGPIEYQAVIEEWFKKPAGAKPKTVVYVINLANDLLEAKRPNTSRHTVWDGWAVRIETAPREKPSSFPGRSLLYRESHAVFALRRWIHGSKPEDERPLPSEGTSKDLIDEAKATQATRAAADQKAFDEWVASLDQAAKEATDNQQKLQDAATKQYPDLFMNEGGQAYVRSGGHPGDIVSEFVQQSEASEGPGYRVRVVLDGAKARAELEAELKKRAEKQIADEEAKAIVASFEERPKIEKKIAELRNLGQKLARLHSPMASPIEIAQQTAKANGAKLVVLILPMDVQVSPDEWKKYGETFYDMEPARILTDDILNASKALGVTAIDSTKALRDAEPGAFLNADLHMSPKGHAAIAKLLTEKMDAPPEKDDRPAIGFAKACACAKSVHATDPTQPDCDKISKTPSIDCLRTYPEPEKCLSLMRCLNQDISAPPKCLPGWTLISNRTCYKECTPTAAAASDADAGIAFNSTGCPPLTICRSTRSGPLCMGSSVPLEW
jgi:hypothetical protein